MSTRCNIIIDLDKRVQLYRHCDGYPDTEHGVLADLAEVLSRTTLTDWTSERLATVLVNEWEGNCKLEGEVVAWEALHGDIEWVYLIRRNTLTEQIEVGVYDWTPFNFGKQDPAKVRQLPVFVGSVNQLEWAASHWGEIFNREPPPVPAEEKPLFSFLLGTPFLRLDTRYFAVQHIASLDFLGDRLYIRMTPYEAGQSWPLSHPDVQRLMEHLRVDAKDVTPRIPKVNVLRA